MTEGLLIGVFGLMVYVVHRIHAIERSVEVLHVEWQELAEVDEDEVRKLPFDLEIVPLEDVMFGTGPSTGEIKH